MRSPLISAAITASCQAASEPVAVMLVCQSSILGVVIVTAKAALGAAALSVAASGLASSAKVGVAKIRLEIKQDTSAKGVFMVMTASQLDGGILENR